MPCDTLPVSDHLVVPADVDSQRARRDRLIVPAALATGIGIPLFAISLLFDVLFIAISHRHPGIYHHRGVTYLRPSRAERVRDDARVLAPIVVGLGLLGLTWRFRGQGRVGATWACAVAVVLMGVLAWW